jgi:hypothetical protein
VQATQLFCGLSQRLFDACVVGDVDRVERSIQRRRDVRAGGGRQIEDGDRRALLVEQFGRGPRHARRATDHDGLLALDLHRHTLSRLGRFGRARNVPPDSGWPISVAGRTPGVVLDRGDEFCSMRPSHAAAVFLEPAMRSKGHER